jgi:hypothetical protein
VEILRSEMDRRNIQRVCGSHTQQAINGYRILVTGVDNETIDGDALAEEVLPMKV